MEKENLKTERCAPCNISFMKKNSSFCHRYYMPDHITRKCTICIITSCKKQGRSSCLMKCKQKVVY